MVKKLKFWINRYISISNLRDIVIFLRNRILGNWVVRLEAASICQLKCPLCPTGKGLTKKDTIGWGYLKFRDFKNFVDGNSKVKEIELSNWGEIFLNPELKDIIKYAHIKNIALTAGNGVNLNTVREDIIESLVKYKFRHLNVSIDGATNETYKIYRVGGNFDRVIENIKKINCYKKKYNSKYPKLSWQFVIFGHNEHELPLAKKMAQELGMKFRPKFNWNQSYSPVKNNRFVSEESGFGVTTKKEFKQKTKIEAFAPCQQLWISPQINWDGKLLGCCVNRYGDFGNVFEKGLKECLKSEKYIYAKKMILGKVKPRKDIPCYDCHYYKKSEVLRKISQSNNLTSNFNN